MLNKIKEQMLTGNLKGLSHENLICVYWCRWKNFLCLFYLIRFLKYRHYHIECFIIRCSAVGFY
jgi:hypothetical protein